jgi:hypothetical protein
MYIYHDNNAGNRAKRNTEYNAYAAHVFTSAPDSSAYYYNGGGESRRR